MFVLKLSERELVEREVAKFRAAAGQEKWRLMQAACRAAAKVLATRSDAQRVLAFADPLPERSRQILAELRAQAVRS